MDKPTWFDAWTRADDAPIATTALEWLRARPPAVRHVMAHHFTPSCVVRFKTGARSYAIVTSVFDDGRVGVRDAPEAARYGPIDGKELEVVGYWRGIQPAQWAELMVEDACVGGV